jgi:hypothetical protein
MTGRTAEGQSTNKTTNMKQLSKKASKKKGWEMVAESVGCEKIQPTRADHERVGKRMKRMVYEKLVNDFPYMSDKDKKEMMKKDDKHIDAVLDNFGINVNVKMMN